MLDPMHKIKCSLTKKSIISLCTQYVIANIFFYSRAGLKESFRKSGKDGGASVAAKTLARLTQSPKRPRTTDRRELLQVPAHVTTNDLESTMVTDFDRINSKTNLREEVNVEMVEIACQKEKQERKPN